MRWLQWYYAECRDGSSAADCASALSGIGFNGEITDIGVARLRSDFVWILAKRGARKVTADAWLQPGKGRVYTSRLQMPVHVHRALFCILSVRIVNNGALSAPRQPVRQQDPSSEPTSTAVTSVLNLCQIFTFANQFQMRFRSLRYQPAVQDKCSFYILLNSSLFHHTFLFIIRITCFSCNFSTMKDADSSEYQNHLSVLRPFLLFIGNAAAICGRLFLQTQIGIVHINQICFPNHGFDFFLVSIENSAGESCNGIIQLARL